MHIHYALLYQHVFCGLQKDFLDLFRQIGKVCNFGFWYAERSYLVCDVTSALWAVALLKVVAQSLALFFCSCLQRDFTVVNFSTL